MPPDEGSPPEEPRSLADLSNPGGKRPSVPAKKSPLPSAEERGSKLAAIKDIYKTEYAAVKPGANPEFVSFLLTTASKVEGDPVARYVLYMEAFKQACTGNDFDAAADAIDKLETEFESEPFPPRYELLSKMAAGAKANDERMIAAKGALSMLDQALALGKFAEADKLARIADSQTKFVIDKELRAKAVTALQTTSELTKDLRAFSLQLTGETQFRWLGPEKGVIHLACGALINAVWDLYAKAEGKPLWRLLADMEPTPR